MANNNPDYIPPLGSEEEGQNFNPPQPVSPPPKPAEDLGIRTMRGDVNSFGASGGLGSEPRTFRPKDLLGNEPLFSPQAPPRPQMPPLSQSAAHSRALVISISAVVGVVLIGVAAYFFFFAGAPEVTPLPPTPPAEPVPPVEPVPPTPPVEPAPPVFQHQSLFPLPSNVTSSSVTLANLAVTDINAGITSAFSAEAKVPILKEIVFSANNTQLTSMQFLTTLVPTLNSAFLELKLDRDFTAFGYKDKDGVWPGYVFKLNPENPPTQNKSDIFPLLEQSNLNFYLSSPGAPKSSEFKSGTKFSQNIQDIRYLQYANPGASFNIAWIQVGGVNYAVVSTSFNGIKEAVRLLGF